MDDRPNYYAIIPAEVRYNENLNSSQKLFYGEITALTFKTGECWASNNYFARLYKISPSLISNWLKALENEKLITIEYETKGKEIKRRIIKIIGIQNIDYPIQNIEGGYSKYLKENNTSINNTSIRKEIYKEKKFKKPTLEEVQAYCKERNNNVNAEQFIDFYESNGWKVGKNSMKDWKASVRTWERNRVNQHKETSYERQKRLLEEICKDD